LALLLPAIQLDLNSLNNFIIIIYQRTVSERLYYYLHEM
jgi:hypothetical protein